VIFTSIRTGQDADGYARTAARMMELAAQQPGYLGIETTRGEDGIGITVSYWDGLESIRNWRQHAEHQIAQRDGKAKWYAEYRLRLCRVEEEIFFDRGSAVK
jgi:heme-degrading monooxygenase HmoA